ncbi:hypothetical protein SPF06_19050 [Sinomonas sp. JGH33]|uniref:ATPase n=1 Tax=Sinomonas terricola TaxID=3110330 RepID=A0ABU5TAV6_9MICC|nr:hypothetical protein [Sinomonas sp. JGH33]MEA5456825.1 hypothetical protein [Sinomonas sp. JGH33]
MPRSNFLDRFRPVGSPGPAARTGVPGTDVVGPAAELARAFASLRSDVEGTRASVEEARHQAERELDAARTAAEAVVAQARLTSESSRRAAYDRVLAASAQDDARLVLAAEARAEQITQTGRERLPAAVHQIIEALLAEAVQE